MNFSKYHKQRKLFLLHLYEVQLEMIETISMVSLFVITIFEQLPTGGGHIGVDIMQGWQGSYVVDTMRPWLLDRTRSNC